MEEKKGRSMWDYMSENPKISLIIFIIIFVSTFWLIKSYNVTTPHISIESKKQNQIIRDTIKKTDEKDCEEIKDKAFKLKKSLNKEFESINDIDLKINLKYWEEKMENVHNIDCSILLNQKSIYIRQLEISDSLLQKI